MPIVMETPEHDPMLFQKVIFELKDLIVIQPGSFISMIIKCRFMCNDKVCAQGGSLLYDINGSKHRRYDALNLLLFVAGFMGSPQMNIGTFGVGDGLVHVGAATVQVPRATMDAINAEGSSQVTMGFRPDALELASEGDPDAVPVMANVVEELGSDAFLYATMIEPPSSAEGRVQSEHFIARVEPRRAPEKGQKVWRRILEGREHFFSVKTGERLPQ